ncbi:MAG: TIR domain-containing protein, partial [Chloroflexi bacterium]
MWCMNQSGPRRHYFISYSHKDQDMADQIKDDLEEQGFEIWLDNSDTEPGTEWDDAIEENIKESIAVLYLVSPNSRSSPYIRHEIAYAKTYKRNIIPLWIKGDTDWARVVAFGLFTTQHIDLREGEYKAGIEKLIQTLKKLTGPEARFMRYIEESNDNSSMQKVEDRENQLPADQISDREREMSEDSKKIGQPPPVNKQSLLRFVLTFCKNLLYTSPRSKNQKDIIYTSNTPFSTFDPPNPYKGLHAFGYEDKWSFFGRENLIRKMIEQVRDILRDERQDSQVPRCMMVVGPSGSGKSSVVMAGLLPALEKNIPEVKDWFFLAPVRPGEFPMDALARTLKLPFLNKPDDSPLKRWSRFGLRKILDDPDSRGLNELLREITHNPDERIVLIVDQFEEIFAPAANPDQQKQRRQFIDSLTAIATEPDTPILLLFTLRADFFHRILDTETLYNQVEPHLINIPPMTREELRSVIEKPAQDVNVTFDPNLAEDLLYEVLKRPESLPLLQFTLEQLFKHREERRLTRQSYDEIGGLQGAIDKHAQATYDKLPTPEHQREARKLFTEYFIYLAESHGEASHLESGEGITRRRVTQAELQLNDSNIRSETINAFIDSRLLTATSTVRQSTDLENITDITYEISHEALINAWEKFREWIKEDRKDIYLIQSLRPRATQWEQEKKKDLLLDKLALQQLREYRKRKELAPPMERIFEASQNQRTRQKSLVYASISLVLAVIVSLALVLVNYNKVFPSPPEPTIVTSKADSGPGTLADVLQKASDEARITFDTGLTGQTICLTSNILGKNVFEINKSITIQGPVASNINISSCTTSNYIAIGQGANVTIEHMAFINSYTHKHSIIENAGNLTMNKSKMSGNKSYNDAGAIYNTGNLILEDDIFDGNKVSTDGGAIKNLYGTVSINKSIISGNEAQGNGGGIYSQGGVVTVSGSRVLNNRA